MGCAPIPQDTTHYWKATYPHDTVTTVKTAAPVNVNPASYVTIGCRSTFKLTDYRSNSNCSTLTSLYVISLGILFNPNYSKFRYLPGKSYWKSPPYHYQWQFRTRLFRNGYARKNGDNGAKVSKCDVAGWIEPLSSFPKCVRKLLDNWHNFSIIILTFLTSWTIILMRRLDHQS